MVRVLVNRPKSLKIMSITTGMGYVHAMSSTPPKFTYSDVAVFGTIERQGKKALTRQVSPGLRSLSFEHTVANLDYQSSIEAVLRKFTDCSASGVKIRFSHGSGSYEQPCWWYISSLKVDVVQRAVNNEPSQAHLSWELVEAIDVTAGASRVVPPPPPPKPPAPKPTVRNHTVVRGDTLWGIAARYLKNGARWPEIFAANKAKIRNPNLIYPGQVFRIPG